MLTVAVTMASYPVGIAGAALVIAVNLWAWQRVKLQPIYADNIKAAKQANWFIAGLYFLMSLFS